MQARPNVFNPFVNNSNSDSDDDIFGLENYSKSNELSDTFKLNIALMGIASSNPLANKLGEELLMNVMFRKELENLLKIVTQQNPGQDIASEIAKASKVSNNPSAMFGANANKKQGGAANDMIKDISDKEMAQSAFGQGSNFARSMKR